MANSSGLNRTGVLSRVTVAAITAGLLATTTAAVAADAPVATPRAAEVTSSAPAGSAGSASAFGASDASAAAEVRYLQGVSGDLLYYYQPTGEGGYASRKYANDTWGGMKWAQQADNDRNGVADDLWGWTKGGRLMYVAGESASTTLVDVGGGWNMYDKLLSPGQLGGGSAADILARDSGGNLWLYLGYSNGKLTGRYKVGPGWNAYTQIAGVGDLSGDGKTDIVARDRSGVLYLYKGTGDYRSPFATRTRIGAGWGGYNHLMGVGDITGDGRADLLARDTSGRLYRYSGKGNASSPFAGRVLIGTSGWNTYRMMF
ncbi:VCBS repeat-containing protein [Streptomyces sp. NPDC018338]|uniref:FG-GAP repeat domain-containing protein n=1 Tax=Streptomyces sp. NPDC018338 TaxID=3157192 RepID=UPI003405C4D1